MVPNLTRETFIQQSLTETDNSEKIKEIKHMDEQKQMRGKNVVTSHRAMQQCSNISEGTSFEVGPSAGRATLKEGEASEATKSKIYHSTCHINLSPPTQNINPQVSTTKL